MPGFCRWWHLARLGMLICAPGCALGTFAQEPLPWVDGSTPLVLLPDTQQYTKSRPQFFEAQTRWVAAQQAPRDIAYIVHMGDITEHDAPQE